MQCIAFKLVIYPCCTLFCGLLIFLLSPVQSLVFTLVVEKLCSLCMGLTSSVCAHGCIPWLETAWFSLHMFFEVKYVHESQDIQQLSESLLWKTLPSFLPVPFSSPPSKWRIMASGYKRLESAIYYMDMQKQLIAFIEKHSLLVLHRWQIKSRVALMMMMQTIPFHIIRILFGWLKTQQLIFVKKSNTFLTASHRGEWTSRQGDEELK